MLKQTNAQETNANELLNRQHLRDMYRPQGISRKADPSSIMYNVFLH